MSAVRFLDELCNLLDKYDVEIDAINPSEPVEIYIKSTGDLLSLRSIDVDSLLEKIEEVKKLNRMNVYRAGGI